MLCISVRWLSTVDCHDSSNGAIPAFTLAFASATPACTAPPIAILNCRKNASCSAVTFCDNSARAELSQKVTAEQEAFLRQFRIAMGGAVQAGVADANAKVKAGMAPLLESWQSTVDSHRTEMHNIYSQMSSQAAEQHRGRLENISVQWMLASVASLDHQSREAIASIANKAEETLRETCAQVFASVGDTLRDRLQAIAANLAVPDPPLKRS